MFSMRNVFHSWQSACRIFVLASPPTCLWCYGVCSRINREPSVDRRTDGPSKPTDGQAAKILVRIGKERIFEWPGTFVIGVSSNRRTITAYRQHHINSFRSFANESDERFRENRRTSDGHRSRNGRRRKQRLKRWQNRFITVTIPKRFPLLASGTADQKHSTCATIYCVICAVELKSVTSFRQRAKEERAQKVEQKKSVILKEEKNEKR